MPGRSSNFRRNTSQNASCVNHPRCATVLRHFLEGIHRIGVRRSHQVTKCSDESEGGNCSMEETHHRSKTIETFGSTAGARYFLTTRGASRTWTTREASDVGRRAGDEIDGETVQELRYDDFSAIGSTQTFSSDFRHIVLARRTTLPFTDDDEGNCSTGPINLGDSTVSSPPPIRLRGFRSA